MSSTAESHHNQPQGLGIAGVRLGHAQSESGSTGCTVVLCDHGAVAGVDIGGSAPGTRETEMLNPTNMVVHSHAVLLTGGSTFGLWTAKGVQDYLVAEDIGFHASTGVVVPIVPTACIFDLDVGQPGVYPDPLMGLLACQTAREDTADQGAVGVGAGATCGKAFGSDCAMRGGLGLASAVLPGGPRVGVVAVCNAWGDVVNLRGEIVAGARGQDGSFIDTERWLCEGGEVKTRYFGMDTTLCVLVTDGDFSREQVTKIAMMTQDGIARVTRPSHTLFDGDVVFALATGRKPADLTAVGTLGARLAAQAIIRGVRAANGA